MEEKHFIHLLYVPTMACNMACRYCYLEDNTIEDKNKKGETPAETLRFAVEKMRSEGFIPFNISLHGGEVTTLQPQDFEEIVAYIAAYYDEHREELLAAGFTPGFPHIKTNLFRLDEHLETIRKYKVSVSGSLDLPFDLHNEYRVTKGGEPTLDHILQNVELLRDMPGHKKVSATIFHEHYLHTDQIIQDIWYLHKNTCLDMNDFNFMVGFEYNSNGLLTAMTEEEQLDFYHQIKAAFEGTELEAGLKGPWFAEFGPGYCTNCDICGEKFYLLERSGDIYSCVRGQKQPDFYYGNIYDESMTEIVQTAREKIMAAHRKVGFDEKCARCGYLSVCKTGCPFVKNVYSSSKSYTCQLQQELYQLWGIEPMAYNCFEVEDYVRKMHPELKRQYDAPRFPIESPNLYELIQSDKELQALYDDKAFILQVDGEDYPLTSQILRAVREQICITEESEVFIYWSEGLLEKSAPYPENNALYIQLLTGDTIVYGDEQRNKQRHIANLMVYKQVAESLESDKEGYHKTCITTFLRQYGPYLSKEHPNNIFFTTAALRDVHYTKQKNNAYYHMQAMDLPFPNIEFSFLQKEDFIL